MSRETIALIAAFVIALGAAFAIGYSLNKKPVPAPPPPAAPRPTPDIAPKPAPHDAPITRAQVNALRYGVTYDDIAQQWNRESDRTESKYDEGVSGYTQPSMTVWHIWDNPDGTRVRLGFTSSKLSEKEFKDKPANGGTQ